MKMTVNVRRDDDDYDAIDNNDNDEGQEEVNDDSNDVDDDNTDNGDIINNGDDQIRLKCRNTALIKGILCDVFICKHW